jgi:hypothetical protein
LLTSNNLLIAIALTLGLLGKPSGLSCGSEPSISLDTLESGIVEAKFDYTESHGSVLAEFMNFTDTLSNARLYENIVFSFHNSSIAFLGKIKEAGFLIDTIINEDFKYLSCLDGAYLVSIGQSLGKVRFQTEFEVLTSYRGSSESESFTIEQTQIFPLECLSQINSNPYSQFLGDRFLFFGNNTDSIPTSGPKPFYSCQIQSGFFVDEFDRVEKMGRINQSINESRKLFLSAYSETGFPGISIPLDSIPWALENVTGIRPKPLLKSHSGTPLPLLSAPHVRNPFPNQKINADGRSRKPAHP